MWDINSVVVVGRLVRDVEIKQISNGSAVANFDIAVGDRPKKDGSPVTYFFPVIAWGKTAENCAKFLSKGKQCCVKGILTQERWQNKEGQSRSKISINADLVEFLNAPEKKQSNQSYDDSPTANDINKLFGDDGDEQVNF